MGAALVGLAGVVLGALIGFVVSLVTARQQREHERRERERAEKATTYVDLLAYLWEGRLYAERISPVFGADLDEPASAPGLAETTRMLARLDAFASPAIRAAARNYTRLINECVHQAMTLRREGRAQEAGSPVAHPVGDWKARSAAGEALVEAWEPLADLVRGELHGLG